MAVQDDGSIRTGRDFEKRSLDRCGQGDRLREREAAWHSRLGICTAGALLFGVVSGLSVWLLPFSVTNQVLVLLHTVVGLILAIPCSIYLVRHWRDYRYHLLTHVKLLGYVGVFVVMLGGVSGVILTGQAVFAAGISYFWDAVHIITTFAVVAFVGGHILLVIYRYSVATDAGSLQKPVLSWTAGAICVCLILFGLGGLVVFGYQPVALDSQFAADYSFKYGKDRPFAPSLAVTETGGPLDPRSLSGSRSCGTRLCHEQIVAEWEVSAHRYSAKDAAFQEIQLIMAEQNGPESTRYCGGCHDPISLFSGAKNISTDLQELTSLHGFQEGVSCLSCHGIRETDLKGNAHYVMSRPARYLFELEYEQGTGRVTRFLRDFLIRAYPRQHVESLSKQLFKTPEYCAACHKQFIDEEINNVGWVQLQNQFDNWRKSRWNHPDDPPKTIECRECHMPLVDSFDPASGDSADYNRTATDGRHRSHRFVAANQMMPAVLKLDGWQQQVELTEKWLRGEQEIPEIADKWTSGPAVSVELALPEVAFPGEEVELRTVLTSNKVGHNFPTGPLDIIQAWLEVIVTDETGNPVYATGAVDDKGFIEPGSFILKAEPIDQEGNLIDRHNLWEMVGVRHRRALFAGFSDIADFRFLCPDSYPVGAAPRPGRVLGETGHRVPVPDGPGYLKVKATLKYRKAGQQLLNLLFGEESGLTAPITDMASAEGTIRVVQKGEWVAGKKGQ